MTYVEVDSLARRYGDDFALTDVSLRLEKGRTYTLMGPSGSGKTSLLRNICGLDRSDSGTVRVGGRDVTGLPAAKRGIGLIFQDLALFPHLTVYENIAYGLRSERRPEGEIKEQVEEIAAKLRIGGLLGRMPSELSGGQRQRVALARSVAPSPALLLLDEPLSSLDQQLRADVRSELKSFSRELGLTMIYVTHDHREGLFLADEAGIMFDGALTTGASPRDLFENPPTARIAEFLGYNVTASQWGRIAFFPSDIELGGGEGSLSGKVVALGYEGEGFRAQVELPSGERVQLAFPSDESDRLPGLGGRIQFRPGRTVHYGD